jgi:hypothetical protein
VKYAIFGHHRHAGTGTLVSQAWEKWTTIMAQGREFDNQLKEVLCLVSVFVSPVG